MLRKVPVLFLLLICIPLSGIAHVNGADLSYATGSEIFSIYLGLGFTHIIPLGTDHILFILSLFLLSPKLKVIVWQATAFTIAHSITLGMAMFNAVSAPSYIIEPIIALSIAFVAIENIISEELKSSRLLIVFLFGLIHGLGFAGVLKDLGLPKSDYMSALISFNIGVELGQLAIIFSAWLLFTRWFNQKPWYRQKVVNPGSAVIAVIALYWTIQRIFFP